MLKNTVQFLMAVANAAHFVETRSDLYYEKIMLNDSLRLERETSQHLRDRMRELSDEVDRLRARVAELENPPSRKKFAVQ